MPGARKCTVLEQRTVRSASCECALSGLWHKRTVWHTVYWSRWLKTMPPFFIYWIKKQIEKLTTLVANAWQANGAKYSLVFSSGLNFGSAHQLWPCRIFTTQAWRRFIWQPRKLLACLQLGWLSDSLHVLFCFFLYNWTLKNSGRIVPSLQQLPLGEQRYHKW